jgi:thiol-disulfide isomerase/thioredoxin
MKSKFNIPCCHLFIVLVILLFGCGAQGGSSEVKQKIKAPQFQVQDINGKIISLVELKGKVVFLDFWATWCPPCVWSSPQVEALAEKYQKKKVEIVSVSLDASESSVRRFVEGKKVKSRLALAGDSGIEVQYRISGIPAFFLIDQNGYLIRRWGGFNENLPALWQKEIDNLLNKE